MAVSQHKGYPSLGLSRTGRISGKTLDKLETFSLKHTTPSCILFFTVSVIRNGVLYMRLKLVMYTTKGGSYNFLMLALEVTSTFVYHPPILNNSKMK
jgi:hypothetical protein